MVKKEVKVYLIGRKKSDDVDFTIDTRDFHALEICVISCTTSKAVTNFHKLNENEFVLRSHGNQKCFDKIIVKIRNKIFESNSMAETEKKF